jgi:hypothetical protein
VAKDGFKTDGIGFSAVLAYLYSMDSLLRVDLERGPIFHWDIPSEDAKILLDDWNSDTLTVQANSFLKAYSQITRLLRDLQRTGQTSWVSTSWINGRGA